LLHAHYEVENRHDLDGIMRTFSPDGEMLYNRQAFSDGETIRMAHAYIGLSPTDGAFRGIRNVIDREHFTADEIVVEGRLCGTHTGEFQGFPPTGREVELPFVAFYRFDASGKLTSERVVMNLGPLGTPR
jgi:predicted ester cyclase